MPISTGSIPSGSSTQTPAGAQNPVVPASSTVSTTSGTTYGTASGGTSGTSPTSGGTSGTSGTSSPVFPDGTLVKGSGQTVYLVFGNEKYGIPSIAVFNKLGLSLKNIQHVGDNTIQDLPTASIEQ